MCTLSRRRAYQFASLISSPLSTFRPHISRLRLWDTARWHVIEPMFSLLSRIDLPRLQELELSLYHPPIMQPDSFARFKSNITSLTLLYQSHGNGGTTIDYFARFVCSFNHLESLSVLFGWNLANVDLEAVIWDDPSLRLPSKLQHVSLHVQSLVGDALANWIIMNEPKLISLSLVLQFSCQTFDLLLWYLAKGNGRNLESLTITPMFVPGTPPSKSMYITTIAS